MAFLVYMRFSRVGTCPGKHRELGVRPQAALARPSLPFGPRGEVRCGEGDKGEKDLSGRSVQRQTRRVRPSSGPNFCPSEARPSFPLFHKTELEIPKN